MQRVIDQAQIKSALLPGESVRGPHDCALALASRLVPGAPLSTGV